MSDSTPNGVANLIEEIPDPRRRKDATLLTDLIATITSEEPRVWNANTIGFGEYHYRYKTGQEGEFFKVGFSPRKDRLTLYIMSGLRGFEDILERLGPHQVGKSTVHIRWLSDVESDVLTELIRECVTHVDMVEQEMGAIPRMSDIPPRQL